VPRHLLHPGQIDAQIQQVPDPCPAQVMWHGRLDLGLEPALPADPLGGGGAEPSQLIALAGAGARLENRAEERARLWAASSQPILEDREGRGRHGDLARLAALPRHTGARR